MLKYKAFTIFLVAQQLNTYFCVLVVECLFSVFDMKYISLFEYLE